MLNHPETSCEQSPGIVRRVVAKCIYPMYNPQEKREELMVIDISYDPAAACMRIDSRTVDMGGRLRFMGRPRTESIANACNFFDAMGIQNQRGLLRDIYFE